MLAAVILGLTLLAGWAFWVLRGWPERRVARLVARMTLAEKIQLLGGDGDFSTTGLPRLGIPPLRMSDGPFGVSRDGPATAMAGGVILAATWNPALAERIGIELGRDARAKGVHLLLGPGVNIALAPMNGRNFEYFGEDPFLASRMAVGYIKGVQSQGVSATPKHFLGNNSEFDRQHIDALIDERALHEIYLPAFEAAVKEARVGAIMASYNRVNGQYMTQNGALNQEILKREWGFDGILLSDWGATHDGVAAALGGLDLEMPAARCMTAANLLPAITRGEVPEALIDEKVTRILRTALRFGWLDRSQSDLSLSRYNEQGCQMALDAAREGMVLLKNERGLLPLDKRRIRTLAIVGPNAAVALPTGGGSARVRPFGATSFLQSLKEYLGPSTQVLYVRGLPTLEEAARATEMLSGGRPGVRAEYFTTPEPEGQPLLTRIEPHLLMEPSTRPPEGARSARWRGSLRVMQPSDLFVQVTGYDSGHFRLYLDDRLVLDHWRASKALLSSVKVPPGRHRFVMERRGGLELCLGLLAEGAVDPQARAIAARADAVVVAAGFDPDSESEGSDRSFALPPGQDALIQAMAAANSNTLVVLTSGGAVAMEPWLDRVPALVQAWYPGQEGGTALAELLFGDLNPSGRLPVSFERRWEDNPVHDSYYPAPGSHQVAYKAGVFVGYRGYGPGGTRPRFPFGFGLSYTTFHYAKLKLRPQRQGCEVSFEVTNTGPRAGAEVAQVYVASPQARLPRPEKELKGFAKLPLAPGETRRVTLTLDERAFSYFDPGTHQWRVDPGFYSVLIGRSCEAIELSGRIALPH